MTFDPDWYYEVDLDWSPPLKVSYGFYGLPDDCHLDYGIYRLERKHHRQLSPRQIIRIGIAYEQSIGQRLNQYANLIHDYRRNGEVWMSYAVPEINGNHKRQRYEDVEHLLIFAAQPRDNTNKLKSVPREDFYKIRNHGFRGQLPREITFPTMHMGW